MPDKDPNSLLLDLWQQQGELIRDMAVLKANDAILLEDRGHAREGRQMIYEKVESIGHRLTKIESLPERVGKLEGEHSNLEERVNVLEGHADRAHGALWVGRVVWTVIAGAVAAAVAWLVSHVKIG